MFHLVLGYASTSISEVPGIVYSGDDGDAAIAAARASAGKYERFLHLKNPQIHGFPMDVTPPEQPATPQAEEAEPVPKKGKK